MSGSLTVEALFEAQREALELEWIAGRVAANRAIGCKEIRGNHSSLIGYLNPIRPNRIQIVGVPELSYLREHGMDIDSEKLRQLFQNDSNIIIFSDAQEVPGDYYTLADRWQVALMRTGLPGHELISSLQHFTVRNLAERVTLHGVFMDVLGIGVLITGASSIGKSELALELVTRGHSLVADDAPEFTRIAARYFRG